LVGSSVGSVEETPVAHSKTESGSESDHAGENETQSEADRVTELHEVRTLNKWLARLRDEFGLRAEVLLPR